MESRSRRKEISCGARPGLVGEEERIWEMWIGLPVSVERMRRVVRWWWVVKRRYSGAGAAIMGFESWGVGSRRGRLIVATLEKVEKVSVFADFKNSSRLIGTPPLQIIVD
jgi:hypothetical protein